MKTTVSAFSPNENDDTSPDGPTEKKKKYSPSVTPFLPSGVQKVTEHNVFVNIFTDGFVAYDNYTRKHTSFYALSLRIENCNNYDAVNEIFSRFVTVIGKGGKKKCEKNVNIIMKVLSAVGKDGVYYVWNDECHHVRWVVDGICGDIVALEEFSNHPAKHCSIHHCMFGNCQRWRLEPLTRLYQQYDLQCTLDKSAISVEVSPPFYSTGVGDFYTNVGYVANMKSSREIQTKITELENQAVAGRGNLPHIHTVYQEASKRLTELHKLLQELRLDKVVFWKESFKSVEQNEVNRRNMYYLASYDNATVDLNRCNGDDNVPLIESLIGRDDASKPTTEIIELEKITPVEEKTRSFLDCMHFIPNFFYRNIRYMNGLIPTPSVMRALPEYEEYLNGLFRDENGVVINSGALWKIPEETMICAMQRLRQFRKEHTGYTWVTEDIILPSHYARLTCEQKILFCLCLFRWVFQDSLGHPYVFALATCLQLIGYLYAFNRYPKKALLAQKRLVFFMGMIETITPPGFTNTSWHNAIHLFDNILNGGTLKEKDDFFCEFLLGLLKGQANGGRNPEISMAKNAIRLQRSAVSDMVIRLRMEKKTKGRKTKEEQDKGDELVKQLPLLKITQANLLDDAEFHREDTIGHSTFLDAVTSFNGMENAEMLVDKWLQPHKAELKEYSVSEWNRTIYSTVKWYGKCMGSCMLPKEGITEKWLKKNERHLGFTRDVEGVIKVYVITGYVVVRVNEMNYIQALCVPLSAATSCSFCESQQEVCVNPPEMVNITIISLFRLHIDRGLILRYDHGLMTFTLMKMVCRQSRNIGHVKLFEKVVRYNVSEQSRTTSKDAELSKDGLIIAKMGLEKKNQEVIEKNTGLKKKNAELKEENAELKKENAELKKENAELKKKENTLKKKEEQLKKKEEMLKSRENRLRKMLEKTKKAEKPKCTRKRQGDKRRSELDESEDY